MRASSVDALRLHSCQSSVDLCCGLERSDRIMQNAHWTRQIWPTSCDEAVSIFASSCSPRQPFRQAGCTVLRILRESPYHIHCEKDLGGVAFLLEGYLEASNLAGSTLSSIGVTTFRAQPLVAKLDEPCLRAPKTVQPELVSRLERVERPGA